MEVGLRVEIAYPDNNSFEGINNYHYLYDAIARCYGFLPYEIWNFLLWIK
jgi:hypothetical protein